MTHAMQIVEPENLPAAIPEAQTLTPKGVREQVQLIQQVMKDVMQDGVHFGKVPGCGDKPSLLKAGAEKIAMTFRLSPTFKITKTDLGNGHREYEVTCSLSHAITGVFLGEGVGSCSTMESKYAYRKGQRICPKCRGAFIIKGKEEYGGGWLCFKNKGGCGEKFPDGDASIEKQNADRVANEDLADQYNTVLKMAKKRAQVDATLTATAASDIFTQDIEDMEFIQNGNGKPAHQQSQRSNTPPIQQPSRKSEQQDSGDCISEAQRKRLYAIYKNAGITDEQMKDYLMVEFGVESSKEIRRSDYEAICNWAQASEAGAQG